MILRRNSNDVDEVEAAQVLTLCVLLTDEVTCGVATGLVGLVDGCRPTATDDVDCNVSADLLVTTGKCDSVCLVGSNAALMVEAAQVLTLCVLLTDEVTRGVATGLVGLVDGCRPTATDDVDGNVSADLLVTTGKCDSVCLVGSHSVMVEAAEVLTLCVLLTDEVTRGMATGLVGLLDGCRPTATDDVESNVSADLFVTTGKYDSVCLVGSNAATMFKEAQVMTFCVLLTDEVTPAVLRVLVRLLDGCAATADVDDNVSANILVTTGECDDGDEGNDSDIAT